MSRIRSIKPEWLDDELLALASSDARTLSIALICLADDYGNGRAARVWLSGRVFPGKPLETLDDALQELVAMRYVLLYEVDGQRYFTIRTWDKNQRVDRPGLPKVPRPNLATAEEDTEKIPFADSQEIPGNSQQIPGNIPGTRASHSQIPLLPNLLPDPDPDQTQKSGSARARSGGRAKPDPVPFVMHDQWAPSAELVGALATKFTVKPERVAAELPEFRYFWKQRGDRKKAQGWERAFSHRIEDQATKGGLYAAPRQTPGPAPVRAPAPKQPNGGDYRTPVERG